MGFLIFVNLIVKPFWVFGIEVNVQNILGAATYGNYFALYNFVILFGIFLDLGINYYNNREISRHPEKLSLHFSNILQLKFFISFGYVLLVLGVAFILQYSSQQIQLLMLLMLNQILLSYLLYFRSNLGALQQFRKDSLISVLDKLMMIFLCGFVIWSGFVDFNIWWFLIVQTIALFISASVSFWLVYKQTTSLSFKLDFTLAKKILLKSYPYALIVLLMGIYTRIDGVMIERMLSNGKQEAGIYAACYRLLDAISQLGLLSSVVLLPVFSKMIKNNQNVWRLAIGLGTGMFVLSLSLAIGMWFFSQPIMDLLYTESNPYYGKIFGLLMFSFVGISAMYVFSTLLTANNNLKLLNFIAVFGVLLNITLNLILIPSHQAFGATIATVFTQSLVAFLQFVFAFRILGRRGSSSF